jgi:hypothetical protein
MTLDEISVQLQTKLHELSTQTGHTFTAKQDRRGWFIYCDITAQAQRVFGDIVAHAQQEVGWFGERQLEILGIDSIAQDLYRFIAYELNTDGNSIDTDAIRLTITFVNGVTVDVNWSQYGSIERVQEV